MCNHCAEHRVETSSSNLQQDEHKQSRHYAEELHAIFDAVSDGVVILSPEARIVHVNDSLVDMLGWEEPGNLTGKFMQEFLDDDAAFRKNLNEIQHRKLVKDFVLTITKKNLETFRAVCSGKIMKDEHGVVLGYVITLRDLTDQDQIETILQENEARFRSLFDNSPISLWEEDVSEVKQYIDSIQKEHPDLEAYLDQHPEAVAHCASLVKIISVNQVTRDWFKLQLFDLYENGLASIFSPESLHNFRTEILAFAKGEAVYKGEMVHLINHQVHHVVVQSSIIPGYEDTWEKVIITLVDITKRVQTENALRESREQLQILVNQVPVGIAAINMQGVITDINPQGLALLGFEHKSDLVEMNVFEMPRLAVFEIADHIRKVLDTGITQSIESWYRAASNRTGFFQARFVPLFNAQKEQVGAILIFDDITERKKTEQVQQAIIQVSTALREAKTREQMPPIILEQVKLLLNTSGTVFSLRDSLNEAYLIERASGILGNRDRIRVPINDKFSGRFLQDGKALLPRLLNKEEQLALSLKDEDIEWIAGIPLKTQDKILGSLWTISDKEISAFDLHILEAIAELASNAIQRVTLFDDLQNAHLEMEFAYDDTLEGWARALELRDIETEGHSRNVTDLTLLLAIKMGITGEDLVNIRRGALLHDVGKMGIPDSILHKPGPLTDEEWQIMRRHPEYAYKMLSPISFLKQTLDVPYYHHEKWDGSGYPQGLAGEEIPLFARIFAVVDVWDALRTNRPYRKEWTKEQALQYIREQSGKHFDPEVVKVFLSLQLE